jgi:hypothetical protein
MDFANEMTIRLPLSQVIALFNDPQHYPKWQQGLQTYETISVVNAKPGAKARLVFQLEDQKIEMIETVERDALPDEHTAIYETAGVWNRVVNRFFDLGTQQTRWVVENEIHFTGSMKVISAVMLKSFEKRTTLMMEGFKAFAELYAPG